MTERNKETKQSGQTNKMKTNTFNKALCKTNRSRRVNKGHIKNKHTETKYHNYRGFRRSIIPQYSLNARKLGQQN